MIEYRLGYYAESLCGHDKGRIYMIISEEGDRVGLCDGIHRGPENPKMKKKKHIQMIRREESAAAFQALISSPEAGRQIREEIETFIKERKESRRM
ncbi:MAG: hypothetical protein IJH71_01315 [Eubacterium sp.]|nr:hypothetical protein [Eubacterium sp.]